MLFAYILIAFVVFATTAAAYDDAAEKWGIHAGLSPLWWAAFLGLVWPVSMLMGIVAIRHLRNPNTRRIIREAVRRIVEEGRN